MPRIRAWELLNNPEYSGTLNMRQLHELLLRAGYSEDVAQKTASQRGWDRLSAGVVM